MAWTSLLLVSTVLIMSNLQTIQSSDWQLVWNDEFEGPDIDTSLWRFEIGDGCDQNICGWGNGEMQWQSNRTENAFVDNGRLIIQARRESYMNKKYTAARMVSRSSWKFGRIEVKAKFPKGSGILANIWLLPAHYRYGIWPTSGEVDLGVMANSQDGNDMYSNALWGTHYLDKGDKSAAITNDNSFSDDFYVYSLEWIPDKLVWFVNSKQVNKLNVDDVKSPYTYPFNERFNLLFSMAIGGDVAKGEPVDTPFPRRLEIDYIRVYQKI